jgi:hypothetical protein
MAAEKVKEPAAGKGVKKYAMVAIMRRGQNGLPVTPYMCARSMMQRRTANHARTRKSKFQVQI